MEAFSAGTLAGAGSFRCESCGFAVALHEGDEVPACPNCDGDRFKRASLFERSPRRAVRQQAEGAPEWLDEARSALVADGAYLAYEDDDRVHVHPLQEGWTHVGRSISAHVRFDDPTVSRRHALVYREESGARILDDRSLNGLFVNGERVDHSELSDGDELAIGRFHLYFIQLAADEAAARDDLGSAAVG